MKRNIYFLLIGTLLLVGFAIATTTITDTGIDTDGNVTSVVRYNGQAMRLSGENTYLRLVATQLGERSAMQWYNGTQIMMSIECHGINDASHNLTGDPNTHCGFYGSNETGSTKKIFNMQWGYEVNNITLENGPLGKSALDLNHAPIYDLNLTSPVSSDIHMYSNKPSITIQDADTSLTSAGPTLQLAESGGSKTIGDYWNVSAEFEDFHFVIEHTSGRYLTINRTSGAVILGTPSDSTNLTMYSPDGTAWSCGVNNAGAWACT